MAAGDGSPEVGLQAARRPAGLTLGYREALRNKVAPRSRWLEICGELESVFWPHIQPSFRLKAGETVFTIGSCFARSIETNIQALGCKVPMLDFRLPAEEFSGQPTSALNKFHPPAFRQSLEWVARIHDRDGRVTWDDCEPLSFDLGAKGFADMDMAGVVAPVPKERFVERRQQIYDTFKTAFTADCLMMTPGLIEAWLDLKTGLYLFGIPRDRRMAATPERWRLEVLPFQQCLDDMVAAIDIVRARNPAVKVLVTTSPVPLARTFTGQDIGVANSHSKAVLRSVCEAVRFEREVVDYFPSYEMAMLSDPDMVWKPGRIHVAQGFVAKIVGRMLDHYIEGVEDAAVRYQEAREHLANSAFTEAESAAREALAARPDHVEARIVLGAALVKQQRWAEAEAELRPAVDADSERSDVLVQMAHALGRGGKVEEAIQMVDAAMDRSSFTINDYVLAEKMLHLAPPAEAVRLGERAVELFPRHIHAHERLCAALVRADRKADARTALRRAINDCRPTVEILLQLARLSIENGDEVEARDCIDRAYSLEPHNKLVLQAKAQLLERAEG